MSQGGFSYVITLTSWLSRGFMMLAITGVVTTAYFQNVWALVLTMLFFGVFAGVSLMVTAYRADKPAIAFGGRTRTYLRRGRHRQSLWTRAQILLGRRT